MDQQIKIVRLENHIRYLRSLEKSNILSDSDREELNQTMIQLEKELNINKEKKEIVYPINVIQSFFNTYYIEPKCINEEYIKTIPKIYQFKIFVSNYHLNYYSEIDIDSTILSAHRIVQNVLNQTNKKKILFRIGFDIRNIVANKEESFTVDNTLYYFQPQDYVRICIKKLKF